MERERVDARERDLHSSGMTTSSCIGYIMGMRREGYFFAIHNPHIRACEKKMESGRDQACSSRVNSQENAPGEMRAVAEQGQMSDYVAAS